MSSIIMKQSREQIAQFAVKNSHFKLNIGQADFLSQFKETDDIDNQSLIHFIQLTEKAKNQLSRHADAFTKTDYVAIMAAMHPKYRVAITDLDRLTVPQLLARIHSELLKEPTQEPLTVLSKEQTMHKPTMIRVLGAFDAKYADPQSIQLLQKSNTSEIIRLVRTIIYDLQRAPALSGGPNTTPVKKAIADKPKTQVQALTVTIKPAPVPTPVLEQALIIKSKPSSQVVTVKPVLVPKNAVPINSYTVSIFNI